MSRRFVLSVTLCICGLNCDKMGEKKSENLEAKIQLINTTEDITINRVEQFERY